MITAAFDHRVSVIAYGDIRLALALEMEDWSLPPEARVGGDTGIEE